MTLPSPVSPLKRTLDVWTTTSPDWLIKYVSANTLGGIEHCANEITAAILGAGVFAPKYLALRYVSCHPMGFVGTWLAIWIERFPFTLADWSRRLSVDNTRCLVDVITKMHSLGIYHCDLHAGNIVLRRLPEGPLEIKVIDFGQSRFCSSESDCVYYRQSDFDALLRNSMRKHIIFGEVPQIK